MKIHGLPTGRRGFTLLEVIIAVAIIGVIAGIALPSYMTFIEKSRAAEAVNSICAIKAAAEMYRLREGGYVYCANVEDINTNYGTRVSNANWSFVADTDHVRELAVRATRTAANGGTAGLRIFYLYRYPTTAEPGGYEAWGGNHPGVPEPSVGTTEP